MPFKSEKQRRYLYANEPKLAKKWSNMYGDKIVGLGGIGIGAIKKIPKAVLNRIDEINKLLPLVNDLDTIPLTYDGGTYPEYVILKKPIRVKNQYVYIVGGGRNERKFEKRYNTNKRVDLLWDTNGLASLKYELSVILRAYKRALKEG